VPRELSGIFPVVAGRFYRSSCSPLALGQAGRWGVTTYLGSRADWKPALYTAQPEPVLAAQLPQHRPDREPLRHHRTASSPVH
jgi:hypothetical protein